MSRRPSNGIFMCTNQAGATSPTTAYTRLGAQQSAPRAAGTCPQSVSPGWAQSRRQAWPEAGGTAWFSF